jgi:hypothetical protein
MAMYTINQDAYEGDIASRLRNWRGLHIAHSGELFEEAAREIEMLRTALANLADQNATFSVIGGNMIVDVDAKLTDAEREAIREAVGAYNDNDDDEECAKIAATLHGLLKRTECLTEGE